MGTQSPLNGAVVEDEALLKQFEALLQAVAGEIGERSVEPHVATLRSTTASFLKATQQEARAIQIACEQSQQQTATLLGDIRTALEGHATGQQQLAAHQLAALEAALEQTELREIAASHVADEVRRILAEGLAANRQAFEQTLDTLKAHLQAYAAGLLSITDTQEKLAEQAVAAAEAMRSEQAREDERRHEFGKTLDAHRAAAALHAASFGELSEALTAQLARIAADAERLANEVGRRDSDATLAIEQFGSQLHEHLDRLEQLATSQAEVAVEQRQALRRGLGRYIEQSKAHRAATDDRLSRVEEQLGEVLTILKAPKGLMSRFKKPATE